MIKLEVFPQKAEIERERENVHIVVSNLFCCSSFAYKLWLLALVYLAAACDTYKEKAEICTQNRSFVYEHFCIFVEIKEKNKRKETLSCGLCNEPFIFFLSSFWLLVAFALRLPLLLLLLMFV